MVEYSKHRIKLFAIIICIIIYSCTTFISNSSQIGRFSAYSYNEPTSTGPLWEAAARKELVIRYAQHYASGVSTSNSYFLGLIDSLYIRVISFFTGRVPIINDPEFVDPLLQWFLLLARGVFCIFLIVIIFLLFQKTQKDPFLAGILVLLFISAPEVSKRGFELKENLEMGVCILFIFNLFLFIDQYKIKAPWFIGIVTGLIAPIKTPVLLFSALVLNSIRSVVAFLITTGIQMLGLFRSSFDLSLPFAIFHIRSMNIGTYGYSFLEIISQNFSHIAGEYLALSPFFIIGIILLFKNVNRNNFIQYSMIVLWFYLAISSSHSQARTFIGFTGIYLTLVFTAIGYLKTLIIRNTDKKVHTLVKSLIFCTFFILFLMGFNKENVVRFQGSLNNVHAYFKYGEMSLLVGEQKILDVLRTGKQVYIDKRIRANVYAEPLSYYSEQIKVIDVINEYDQIKNGSTLFTICYPLDKVSEYGLTSLGVLADIIMRECGNVFESKYGTYENMLAFQNQRVMPIRSGGVLAHSVNGPIGIREYILRKDQKISIPATFFNIKGPYLQEWQSRITNLDFARSSGFELSKKLGFEPGLYKLKPELKSNYREDQSTLTFYLDNQPIHTCKLSTLKQLRGYADSSDGSLWSMRNFKRTIDSSLLRFFGMHYAKWRNKYFPVNCEFDFRIRQAGIHEIRMVIKTQEPNGSIRFGDFDFAHTGN